ncbi:disease resistance protein RPM1-like [Panicum miliaceum]|uniref:Disease resistance protein RPM1-like n=1 Tax=Panicum miliaceum TaxID=4540 RepID=A0A3L6Q710_PANMI|nr:disease resistance protein RPM1-like [Panicum miliaceum]
MASKEEQGMGEAADTVAPAAPERQHDVDSTVDERKKKLIEEAISSLRSCSSEMLDAARRLRVTGDLELRCLDFLEKELSFIVAGLTALSPQHVDEEMMGWLRELTDKASRRLPRALDEADPQRNNTLLRRASRFFRRRHRHPVRLLESAIDFYRLAEDPCRYRHLLPDTSRHRLPPQAAEEGGGIL